MNNGTWSIGVDLGGTKLEVAAVDSEGKIIDRIRIPTQSERGPDAIIGDMAAIIEEVAKKQPSPPQGVGIGTAGQIDGQTGMIYFSPNLPNWNNVPLQATLQQKLDLPVFVINDVRAATYGEWLFGAGKGCEDFICLFVGTGIGSGIVSGGKLLTGASNSAGELGHIIIDLHGLPCTCGSRGCFETLAGGWSVAVRAQIAIQRVPDKGEKLVTLAGGTIDKVSAQHVLQAAEEGDSFAKQLVAETMEGLIAGCTSIVNALNPSRLIIGGGLGEALPSAIAIVKRGIHEKAFQAATKNLQVLPTKLGNDAGVVGAAILTTHQ